MRTVLCLLLSWAPIINTFSAAASSKTVPGPWEVLEDCRLIPAKNNDGDSFRVSYQDKEFIIRLYYVDCPETYDTYIDRLKDQARYFSISESEVLTSGKAAKMYTQDFLKNKFTVITCWEDARGGKEARYFGIIQKKKRLLSTELVRNGLARIYGMPTRDKWPGGFAPAVYLKQLKQHERIAQRNRKGIWGSAQNTTQLAGTDMIGERMEALQTNFSTTSTISSHQTGKIILNTCSALELEALPGIGPALAERIIAKRPFTAINDLVEISGISMKKIDAFRDLVLVDEPPPPTMTADFYRANSDTYLNKEVTVKVSMVTQSELPAPDGFRAVYLETANQGKSGGSIPAFVPEEYYDSFISYYRMPNRPFTGLLFQQNDNIVLVYRRK